jgi:hypothetical protein
MRSIGFTVAHGEYDLTTLIAKIDAADYDMYFLCWINMGRFGDHIYDFFHSSFDFPAGSNRPGLHNDDLDVVLEELYTTLDKGYMETKIVEALEMIMGSAAYQNLPETDGIIPYIPIYSRTYYNAHDEDLLGLVNAKFDGSWNGYTASKMVWRTGNERPSDLVTGGNMVVWCHGEDPQTPANPIQVSSAVTWDVLDYVYEGLIGVNPFTLKDSFFPDALDETVDPDWPSTPGFKYELWTVTDGPKAGDQGMKVTYYLDTTPRYWHDGHQFDVYDIAFAWEYLTANKVARAWGTMQHLHHVTVEDAHTITAYMTETGLPLFYGLSTWSCLFPEHIWGNEHDRAGRATGSCPWVNREDAWNAQLAWITSTSMGATGTAGTKPATDPDATVESGLCMCDAALDPPAAPPVLLGTSKTTCEHSSGSVIDDRSTGATNEVLQYDPEEFAHATVAYPFLTELIGTGAFVYHDINLAAGTGNLIAYDLSTHDVEMPNCHYHLTTDQIDNDLLEEFWELGDVNLDGEVRIVPDIATMGALFMQVVGPNHRADVKPFPEPRDEFVDMRDLTQAGQNYGEVREVT